MPSFLWDLVDLQSLSCQSNGEEAFIPQDSSFARAKRKRGKGGKGQKAVNAGTVFICGTIVVIVLQGRVPVPALTSEFTSKEGGS